MTRSINFKIIRGVIMSQEKSTGAGLPTLSKSTIWMINFGFLGVQTAFTLQSSQMSRIFQTIGADPNNLGWLLFRTYMGTKIRWSAVTILTTGNDCSCYRYDFAS